MSETKNGLSIKKMPAKNGVNIIVVKTDKFKTNSINLLIHNQLERESVTKNALIPMILKRGSIDYPTMKDISKKLQDLYGSFFNCGVVKKGERQIQHFYIDGINPKYTQTNENIFLSCAELLNSLVKKPLLENESFKNDYINQEKENLKKLIQSRKNDKVQYAVERCYELMCSDERYGIHEWGYIDDLDKIDGASLYSKYTENINTCMIDLLVLGDISDEWIHGLTEKLEIKTDGRNSTEKEELTKEIKEVRNFVEEMDVNQGKLSMGLRTNTAVTDSDYYDLVVYNSILGGGVHSKLFQNVREKESLAYYVFSRLEKFKGLMMIGSGIEASNFDKTRTIILEQMNEIQEGKISDFEFDSSIKSLESNMRNIADEPTQLVDFCLGQSITGVEEDFETIIERIKKVSRKDVMRVAQKVNLDTVHFIKPRI